MYKSRSEKRRNLFFLSRLRNGVGAMDRIVDSRDVDMYGVGEGMCRWNQCEFVYLAHRKQNNPTNALGSRWWPAWARWIDCVSVVWVWGRRTVDRTDTVGREYS